MGTKTKVFGIGFHKTGTTSLARALYILGYNVTGYFGVHDPAIGKKVYDQAYRLAQRYDAVQDTPWPVLYRELDGWFPGSKFILTVRAPDLWMRSVKKHFKRHRIAAHEWIYGVATAAGNESTYLQRFQQHNRKVVEYFQNRPDDLLVMDITKGDGWETLCPFLGRDRPSFEFPTANAAAERSENWVKRGRRFISRRINPDQDPSMEWGVPSAFLRDVLHYHLSKLENLWGGIELLNEEQYCESEPDHKNSIREIWLCQVAEMHNWYQRLTGGNESMDSIILSKKYLRRAELKQFWQETGFLLRRHAAHLADDDFYARVPARQEAIREVYLHLMDRGAQRSDEIRRRLGAFGICIEEQTVMSFFYNEIKCHHPNL
jgi:hypothetical protein